MIPLFEWKSGTSDAVRGELFLLAWVEIEYRWAYRDEREYPEYVDFGGEA